MEPIIWISCIIIINYRPKNLQSPSYQLHPAISLFYIAMSRKVNHFESIKRSLPKNAHIYNALDEKSRSLHALQQKQHPFLA